ncbi:RNA 3'-terminal phosphate cyclase [Ixodes scapularis]
MIMGANSFARLPHVISRVVVPPRVMAKSSTGCYRAGSALGKRGSPAEAVGEAAARDLLRELERETCVDSYLQDQLVVFAALASGKSRILSGPLTLHTETAIHVAHLLTTAKFSTVPKGDCVILECEGASCSPTNA